MSATATTTASRSSTGDGGFVAEYFYLKETLGGGAVWDLGFWPDAPQTFLFIADGENNEVRILARADGTLLAAFGRAGRQAGQFHWVRPLGAVPN